MLLARFLLARRGGQAAFGTWGYDPPAWTASVKPGDGFFAVCQRHLGQAHRDRRRTEPSSASIRSSRPDRAAGPRRSSRIWRKNPHSPAAVGQQIGDAYAQLDGRGRRSSAPAPLRSSPISPRSTRSETSGELVELLAQPGYASPVGIDIVADQDDPTRYAVYAGQAGLGLPNRDYYLLQGAKYDAYPRRLSRITSSSIQSWPACPMPRPGPTASSRSKPPSPRTSGRPSSSRDVEQDYNPMTRAQLHKLRAAVRVEPRRSPSSASASVRQVVVGRDRARSRARQAAGRRAACRPGRNISPSTSSATTPASCPRRSTRPISISTRKTLRDVPEQRDRWKRGVDMRQRRARRSCRPDLRRAPLSARKRPADGAS